MKNNFDKKIEEIRRIFKERSTPLANEHYMLPAVAIDPNKNLALVVEAYQATHPELRLMEVRNNIIFYDIKQDKIIKSWNHTQKTGPGYGIGEYECKEFIPKYDKEKKKLCLVERVSTCNSVMETIKTEEKQEWF